MKTVIVTGVSRGLGLAIAERVADDGYKVLGYSRSETAEYQHLMEKFPDSVVFRPLDMSDPAAIAEAARTAIKQDGPIYGLVNNAAIALDSILATMYQTDIDKVISTNLVGPITLTKYVMRSMLSRGEGRIINISSIIAATGFHGLSVYAATKAGIEGFTRSLSREAGKRHITVNCVAPGYMETAMTAGLQGTKLESVKRRAPLGLPKPLEVAAAVSYLLRPEAATVTGTVITVDGGATA